MFKFIEFLQKRPKDPTIRAIRGGYALALAAFLALAHGSYDLPSAAYLGANDELAEFALAGLALVPGAVAAAGWCVAKRKKVRLAQLAGGIFLFVLAATVTPVLPEQPAVPTAPSSASGELSASELMAGQVEQEAPIDVSGWLKLFAILPILSAISGKMVTEKCLKYGVVIKKIRV